MTGYVLLPGSDSGVRVAAADTGETVSLGGRLFDNMTTAGAEEALRSLERLTRLRAEHRAGELRRNDLLAILDRRAGGDLS